MKNKSFCGFDSRRTLASASKFRPLRGGHGVQRSPVVHRLFAQERPQRPPASSVTASNVTLTAAQRQNIQLTPSRPSKFHKTIETTGAVDFDNDQATSVLAPFSGPVSRLLVSPGDKVKAGDPLAEVDSPDFAAAISAIARRSPPPRPSAGWPTWTRI
jgi:membrane fusion protein, heavy metal efflux system